MKIEVLQAFLTIAKECSLSKAAELHFVSQSTISRYIAELEAELNCTLFFRTPRGVQLNQTGLMIYGQVQRLIDNWEQIRLDAARYNTHMGVLRIGYVFTGILPFISRALEIRRYYDFDSLSISLHYGQANELCQMVLHNLLDCVIVHRPSVIESDELQVSRIASCSLGAMFDLSHPLAKGKSVTMEQLSRETESRCDREPEWFSTIDNAYLAKGYAIPSHVMTSEAADCYFMIKRKGYFCYRPTLYPPEGESATLPITDWLINWDLMFVRRDKSKSIILDSLFAAMQQVLSTGQ